MIVRIGGEEFELEGVRFGQTPACRLKRRNGPMLTTKDFAAMPGHQGLTRSKNENKIGFWPSNFIAHFFHASERDAARHLEKKRFFTRRNVQ